MRNFGFAVVSPLKRTSVDSHSSEIVSYEFVHLRMNIGDCINVFLTWTWSYKLNLKLRNHCILILRLYILMSSCEQLISFFLNSNSLHWYEKYKWTLHGVWNPPLLEIFLLFIVCSSSDNLFCTLGVLSMNVMQTQWFGCSFHV